MGRLKGSKNRVKNGIAIIRELEPMQTIVTSVDSMTDALIAKIDVVELKKSKPAPVDDLEDTAKVAQAKAEKKATAKAKRLAKAEAKLATIVKYDVVIAKSPEVVITELPTTIVEKPVIPDKVVMLVKKLVEMPKGDLPVHVVETPAVTAEVDKIMRVKELPTTIVLKPTIIESKAIKTFVEDKSATIDSKEDPDLEIIEVSQLEVKVALKNLVSRQNDKIAELYDFHDKYNQEFFYGRLSVPFITIEKMSNKTLGSYMPGLDATGIESHMRFNVNFIALNTETRISETVRHEMIHQWQDEVVYAKQANATSEGHEGDKRPKEWHNVDFKDKATAVGILANGKHCTGSPAMMPEAKSYNRKFACGCMATNGHRMTIWSTREVDATCNVCGEEYEELKKAGGTIKVNQSDIEKPNEDAVKIKMTKDYAQFENFQDKAMLTEVVKSIKKAKAKYKEGIYQKGHNEYARGIRYWVAWNMPAPKTKTEGGK